MRRLCGSLPTIRLVSVGASQTLAENIADFQTGETRLPYRASQDATERAEALRLLRRSFQQFDLLEKFEGGFRYAE